MIGSGNNKGSYRFTLSLQYFLYFGVMGIFLPYFNLYCYHLKLTGFQIDILSAVRTLVMVVFSLIWGIVADQYAIRRPLYIMFNAVSCAVWALYLITTDFVPMLVVTILYSVFYGPIIAFLEAFTMDSLGVSGGNKREYGNIRVWGSLNFILVVGGLGMLIDRMPIKTIVFFVLAGSFIQAVLSVKVPATGGIRNGSTFFRNIGRLAERKTIVFLFCSFLMLASHGTYYGFFSINLEKLGYSRSFIGLAWVLASLAEIGVMLKSDFIFKRFSIRTVLIFSFFTAALRWMLLFFAVSPSLILISQLLHAVTYGAFHIACILYMDEISSKETKTFCQVANNAVSYGLGMMAGFVLNGIFYERHGSYLYIASCILALSGAIVFFISGKSRNDLS